MGEICLLFEGGLCMGSCRDGYMLMVWRDF